MAKQINRSEVLSLLDQGKTRKEIAAHFGVPMSVMKAKIWSDPSLKNLKAKKHYDLELVHDDVATESASTGQADEQNTDNVQATSTEQEETVTNDQAQAEETPLGDSNNTADQNTAWK